MRIRELVWDDVNTEKCGRRASQEEVEEAVSDAASKVYRVGTSNGGYRRYAVLGLTEAGRYLTVFLDYYGRGRARPVTVRNMDDKEMRWFKDR